jgi:hypothetical protein
VGLALFDGQTWPIETEATVINRTFGAEARRRARMPVAIPSERTNSVFDDPLPGATRREVFE